VPLGLCGRESAANALLNEQLAGSNIRLFLLFMPGWLHNGMQITERSGRVLPEKSWQPLHLKGSSWDG
jgi:hypothetical protein